MTPPEPTKAASPLLFRGETYHASVERDGTVAWSLRDSGAVPKVTRAQVDLAERLFSALEDGVRDGAVRLLASHGEWFGKGTSAAALARDLTVTRVRIPPDVKDATVYAEHVAFSGHVAEIALSPTGRVLGATLLG